MERDSLTEKIIGCAIEIHRITGPGLLESAYEKCMSREMALNGINFQLQVAVPIEYKGIRLNCGYRIDVLVEKRLIIELKSIEKVQRIHHAQILTYMKLSKISTGLILNFNVELMKDGISRFKL